MKNNVFDFLGFLNSKLFNNKYEYFDNFIKILNEFEGKHLFIFSELYYYINNLKLKDDKNYKFLNKNILFNKSNKIIISNNDDIEDIESYIASFDVINFPNAGHLMVDIETMGDMFNSPIISIGAVEFDILTGKTYREFYMPVSLKSSLDLGTKPNADTILWWMKQSDDARKTITENKSFNIQYVLKEFRDFIYELKPENLQIWGNSNSFDLGTIANSFGLLGQDIPWKYSLERDVRTLVSFKPEIKEKYKNNFKGIQHHPINDCKNQIGYCSEIYNDIFVKKINN